MTITTLHITRHGTQTVAPRVGHVLTPPPEPWGLPGALNPSAASLAEAFGWTAPQLPGARFTHVDASSLVCPSPWERAWLAWLVDALEFTSEQLTHPVAAGPHHVALRTALAGTSSWAGPTDIPDGARLVRATSRRDLVRTVASDLRERALTHPDPLAWLDRVLVLASPDATVVWSRGLTNADLPVRASVHRPASSHPLGAWLLALLRTGNATTPRGAERRDVRTVLEGPWWSAKALAVAAGLTTNLSLRRAFNEALRTWRRPRIHAAPFEAHLVRTLSARKHLKPHATGIASAVRTLFDALGPGPGRLGRLAREVRRTLGTGSVIGRDHPHLARLLEEILDGTEDDGSDSEHQLRARLGRSGVTLGTLPEQGVTVLPLSAWDGREVGHLVVADLQEGGLVTSPAPLGTEEAPWWDRLTGTDGSATDREVALLEHGIAHVAHALSHASEDVTLAWHTLEEARDVRYVGPVLGMLVGGWSEKKDSPWRLGHPAAVDVPAGAALPVRASASTCARELRAFSRRIDAPLPEEALADRECLASSAASLRERTEGVAGTGEAGAWSGRLPGAARAIPYVSPTALETMGACGTKYYLDRILGLSEDEEAGPDLDGLEVGSLVHDALERAARDAIAAQGAWDLWVAEGTPKATRLAAVDRAHAEVVQALDETVADLLADQPSLSASWLAPLVTRWKAALRTWLDLHLAEVPSMDDEGVDDLEAVRKAEKAIAEWEAQRDALRAAATASPEDDDFPWRQKKHAENLSTSGTGVKGLPKKALGEAWRRLKDEAWAPEALEREVETLLAEVDEKLTAQVTARDDARAEELARRAAGFVRRVVGAEVPLAKRDEPLVVDAGDGRVLPLVGTVDRIDHDPERNALAVRDYKSGNATPVPRLQADMLDGVKLQLPLYARAVTQHAASLGLPADAPVTRLALDHPKAPKKTRGQEAAELGVADADLRIDGEAADWIDVGTRWAAAHHEALEAGQHDLRPTRCPHLSTGAYCDHERTCGVVAEALEALAPRPGRPEVELVEEEKEPTSRKPDKTATRVPPTAEVMEVADAGRHHARAGQAAMDTGRDVLISAGAGTGKTHHLVLRYLAALRDGTPPSNIVAVTFTRKAAAEMRARIRQALLSTSHDDPRMAALTAPLRADPTALRRLVLSLSAAPILTIDAFVGRLLTAGQLAQAAASGEVVPAMRVADPEELRERIASEMAHLLLTDADAKQDDVALLLRRLPPATVKAKLVDAVMSAPADLEAPPDATAIRDLWLAPLLPELDAAWGVVSSWPLDELDPTLDDGGSPNHRESLARLFDGLVAAPEDPLARAEVLHLAASLPYSAGSIGRHAETWAKPTLKAFKNDWMAQHPVLGDFLKAWAKQRAEVFVDPHLPDEPLLALAETASAAWRVVLRYADHLHHLLVDDGVLRFEDASRRVAEMLEDDLLGGELAARAPAAHLFVDEAQDTSAHQVGLLRRYAGLTGATSYWVGDVKQSIYRFRGAEVDVFADLAKELAAEQLTENRRSEQGILRVVNRLFAAAFSGEGDPGTEIPHAPLVPPEATSCDPEPDRVVWITSPLVVDAPSELAEDATDGDAADSEETSSELDDVDDVDRDVIAEIAAFLETHEAREGGDVAVLTHSWKNADTWRRTLRAFGIQATVQGGRGLIEVPSAEAAMHWLQWLALGDEVALAGALRGPGVAMTDVGLVCLRHGRGLLVEEDGATVPWDTSGRRLRLGHAAVLARGFDVEAAVEAWRDEVPSLDEGAAREALDLDQSALARFHDAQDAARPLLREGRVVEALEAVSQALSWRAWWGGEPGGRLLLADLDAFMDLVEQTSLVEPAPADTVRALLRLRDEDASPASGTLVANPDARVVVTTVYQAKGREWPMVVVPDLEKHTVSSRTTSFVPARAQVGDAWTRVPFPPSAAPDAFKASMPEVLTPVHTLTAGRADRSELRRLLYVALTRPQKRLVLSSRVGLKKAKGLAQDADGPKARLCDDRHLAETLATCADLRFDAEGAPYLGEKGCWAADDLTLRAPREVLPEPRALPTPEPGAQPPPSTWAPFRSPERVRIDPSRVPMPFAAKAVDVGEPTPWHRPEGLHAATLGTAVHALFEQWAFVDAPPTEASLPGLSHALVAVAIEHLHHAVSARPEVVQTLARAAAAGRVFHEVPVVFPTEHDGPALVRGFIDLLWADDDGRWHVCDYKTTEVDDDGPLPETTLAHHLGQVAWYARALEAVGVAPATVGVWYTGRGQWVQVDWPA